MSKINHFKINGTIYDLTYLFSDDTLVFKKDLWTTETLDTNVYYTQTISCSGLLSTDKPFIDLNLSSDFILNGVDASNIDSIVDAWDCIDRFVCLDDKLTAICYSQQPQYAIPILLRTIR